MTTTTYCETCGQVLSSLVNDEGSGYVHGPSEAVFGWDHPAVPVKETPNAETHCDFCNTNDPTWVFRQSQETKQTIVLIGENDSRSMDLYDEDWAACDTCMKKASTADDPKKLAEWVLNRMAGGQSLPREATSSLVSSLTGMYRAFIETRILPAIPLDEYEENYA